MRYPTEDTRKFRVRTKSGSEYDFDNGTRQWRRVNTNPGHENIRFTPEGWNSDLLDAPVEPVVGEGLTFFTAGTWVRTTTVVSVEEV